MKKTPSKLNLNTNEIGTPGANFATPRDGQGSVKTIHAPVTTGSMMRPVLSHDAVHQMTQQVSLMNQAKQDGEIKIRLKPDHLGELSMSIKNQGQQISIRIHAQNPEARQILESSLGTLRDSLSKQNLVISRMEITHAPTPTQGAAQEGTSMQMDSGQFRQQQSDTGYQQQQQQESMANRNYWKDEDSIRANAAAPVGVTRARSAAGSTEGLDLIA